MHQDQKIKFYTIHKKEYNHYLNKLVDKKYKFFTKMKWSKEIFFPPTHKHVLKLDREKVDVNVNIWFKQNPVPASVKKRFAENIELQADIMRIIKKRHIDFNYPCGIIKAKTGIWKSHIVMDIIEYLQTPTLVLVSNKKLMQEMIDKFKEHTNITPSQYWWWKKDIWNITIMTKSSLIGKWSKATWETVPAHMLSVFWAIISDECHQGFTEKFRNKLNYGLSTADVHFYWLSATPYTDALKEEDLEKYYGKIIEVKKWYDFIPTFHFYNYASEQDYEHEHYADLRWQLSEDMDRMWEQQKVIEAHASDICSLILCDRLAEIEFWTEKMTKSFPNRNIIVITGQTKVEDDARLLQEARENDMPTIIIWSRQKCSTGFDYPEIDTVFLFSAIKFEATVIQSVWRALRKSPGKTWADVYVWNDKILSKQRREKRKSIISEYWIQASDIKTVYIWKSKKSTGEIVLEF